MTSPKKPALWTAAELAHIANTAAPQPTPDTYTADAAAITAALATDLARRNLSIANDQTATQHLCKAAAISHLTHHYRDNLATAIATEIKAAREHGASWADIASAFDITPRRAMELYNPATAASRRAYEERRSQTRRQPS